MHITTEDLVTSLLSIGYDKVDQVLFTKAKRIISTGKTFKFIDPSISKICNNSISYDGNSFRLNNETSNIILDRNIKLTNYLISTGFGIVSDRPKTKALVKPNN